MDWEVGRFANFQPESNFGDAQIEKRKSLEEFIEHSRRYQANLVDLGALPEVTTGKAQLTVWLEDASGQVLGRNHLDATDFVLRRVSPQPHP